VDSTLIFINAYDFSAEPIDYYQIFYCVAFLLSGI
jgi:hypothetical protein